MELFTAPYAALGSIAGGLVLLLCLLTRKVDGARLAASIERVNGFFVYAGESGLEKWRVLSVGNAKGDCEDYALTAIYDYTGGGLAFLWAVSNPFKFRLWNVTDPSGVSHFIAVCSEGAFDNHRKQLTAVSDYKARGYKFRFVWPFPWIWLKLIIGKF